MRVLVTGVAGQLGHDVMNELAKRGYGGIGSDLAPEYAGIADGTAVTSMPYVQMDITDADAVDRMISEAAPDPAAAACEPILDDAYLYHFGAKEA